jgi:hypothetical protein
MADRAVMEERPPFQVLPPGRRARLFGVDYAIVSQPDGGELYVSRIAWRWLDWLQPDRWWDREDNAVRGERLSGSKWSEPQITPRHTGRYGDQQTKRPRAGGQLR